MKEVQNSEQDVYAPKKVKFQNDVHNVLASSHSTPQRMAIHLDTGTHTNVKPESLPEAYRKLFTA
eukprot:1817716-Amphidinium_carterae.1